MIAGIVLACTTGFLLFALIVTCCYCCCKLYCKKKSTRSPSSSYDSKPVSHSDSHKSSSNGYKKCCYLCCKPKKKPQQVVVAPPPQQPSVVQDGCQVIDIPGYHQDYAYSPVGSSGCGCGAMPGGPAFFSNKSISQNYLPPAKPSCGCATSSGNVVRLNNPPQTSYDTGVQKNVVVSYIAAPTPQLQPSAIYQSIEQPHFELHPSCNACNH